MRGAAASLMVCACASRLPWICLVSSLLRLVRRTPPVPLVERPSSLRLPCCRPLLLWL